MKLETTKRGGAPMKGPSKVVIDDATSLDRLRARHLAKSARFVLAGPLIDDTLERTINRTYRACGCEEGSVVVLLTLVGSVAFGLRAGFYGSFVWWRIGLYVLGAALVGKMIGIVWNRLRMMRALRLLYGRLEIAEAEKSCGERSISPRMREVSPSPSER